LQERPATHNALVLGVKIYWLTILAVDFTARLQVLVFKSTS